MYLCRSLKDFGFPESYSLTSKSDVLNFILSSPYSKIIASKSVFPVLFECLYTEMSKIQFPKHFKFQQKLFHFLHNDISLNLNKCPICGNEIIKFYGIKNGYAKTCSKKCGIKLSKQTYEQTCLEKYGVKNYGQTEEYKEKFESTCIKKYGCKNPFQNPDIKEKIKKTNQIIYGVDNPSQNSDIKKKKEITCLSHFNVKYPSQSKEVLIKTKQTKLEKYGDENYNNIDKNRQTCLEKYGVKSYTQTQECVNKMKSTCLKRYGIENYSKTQECIEKIKSTCLEKYGVDNYSKTNDFSKQRRKRIKYDNLLFDSNWEIIVYKYCKLNNFDFEYQPNILYQYTYDNKTHIYQPDFLINGKVYEVKGDHFFEGDKMICPFDRTKDSLFDAKYQCMKDNNVIILKESDILILKEKLKELE